MPAIPAGCTQRAHPPCPAVSPQSSRWCRDSLESLGSGECILVFLCPAAKTRCDVLLEEQPSLGVSWDLPAAASQPCSRSGEQGGTQGEQVPRRGYSRQEEQEGGNSRPKRSEEVKMGSYSSAWASWGPAMLGTGALSMLWHGALVSRADNVLLNPPGNHLMKPLQTHPSGL